MNPTIAQMLVQSRQQDLQAEATRARLAATAKAARRGSPAGAPAGTWRRFTAFAAILGAAAR